MQWKFTFKQVDSSMALQTYSQDTFEKISGLLLKESQWHVFYSIGKFDFSVEVFVTNSHGRFKAKAVSKESLYIAVDSAADKLSKQFQKHKEKMQDHAKYDRSRQGRLERVNRLLEYDSRPFPDKKTA
jgi:ribosomal subunit interface protein